MIFIEKLSAFDVLRLLVTRKVALHGGKSLGARIMQKLIVSLGYSIRADRIDFGNVAVACGIRGNSYLAAEAELERLPGRNWAESLSHSLGIDFWLVMRKFFFDEFYLHFEFLEFALRYADEHPLEDHELYLSKVQHNSYCERLTYRFKIRVRKQNSSVGLLSLMLLPFFVELFRRRKGESGSIRFDRQVVCQVDSKKTLEMFSSLFCSLPREQVAFVTEERNALEFEPGKVHVLRLRDDGARYLRRVVWIYLWHSVRHLSDVSCHGSKLFRLFYVLMQGRAETICGSENLYCTYEHLITPKWIRNAYLKEGGNQSVFVSMNAYVTPHYFHSEIFLNYDIVCAAGPHTEALYTRKRALTNLYLPTGSYDSHRGVVDKLGKASRLNRLRQFQRDRKLVVILSPGICDPTYGHELKLMALARSLSDLPDICVVVRLKPVQVQPKYTDFYKLQTSGCADLLVTAGDYELFDFIELDCLFVTTISNAAYDLAQAGAQVMFIDYLKDPELILCWSEVPGVLLKDDEAMVKIADWLYDRNAFRHSWSQLMSSFSTYIGYRHTDFEGYRSDFLQQLLPFAPQLKSCEAVVKSVCAPE